MCGLVFFITNMDTVQKGALSLICVLQCSEKKKKKEEEKSMGEGIHGNAALLFRILWQLVSALGGEESKNQLAIS